MPHPRELCEEEVVVRLRNVETGRPLFVDGDDMTASCKFEDCGDDEHCHFKVVKADDGFFFICMAFGHPLFMCDDMTVRVMEEGGAEAWFVAEEAGDDVRPRGFEPPNRHRHVCPRSPPSTAPCRSQCYNLMCCGRDEMPMMCDGDDLVARGMQERESPLAKWFIEPV